LQASFDSGNVASIFAVRLNQLPEEAQGFLVMGAGFFDPVLVSIQDAQVV
jgi:hypothetical protein